MRNRWILLFYSVIRVGFLKGCFDRRGAVVVLNRIKIAKKRLKID